MPHGAPNEKTQQSRRRLARQLDEVEQLVTHINTTSVDCLAQPPDLSSVLPDVASPVNWQQLPVSCHPGGVITPEGDKNPDKQAARVHRKQLQVDTFAVVLQHLAATAQQQPQQQRQQQRQQQQEGEGKQPAAATASSILTAAAVATEPETSHRPPSTDLARSATAAGAGVAAQSSLHVVDFGCGTGNLLLPLAVTFPHWHFTGVDMKPAALSLLQQRAATAGLTNVTTFQGMIEQYGQPFDLGLALHACGNATDRVLQLCCYWRAAFVVSPCCIGKLRFSLTGGSSFHPLFTEWTPQRPGNRPSDRAADKQRQLHWQQQQKQKQAEDRPSDSPSSKECQQQQPQPQDQPQQRQQQPAGAPPVEEHERLPGATAHAGAASGASPILMTSAAPGLTGTASAQATASGAPGLAAAAAVGPCPVGTTPQRMPPAGAAAAAPTPGAAGAKARSAAAEAAAAVGGVQLQHATMGDALGSSLQLPALTHPRSNWLAQLLTDPERHFRLLAKVADIAHSPAEQQLLSSALAARADVARRAKRAVELDRAHAAAQHGYLTLLLEVLGARDMAKADMLVGVPQEHPVWAGALQGMMP